MPCFIITGGPPVSYNAFNDHFIYITVNCSLLFLNSPNKTLILRTVSSPNNFCRFIAVNKHTPCCIIDLCFEYQSVSSIISDCPLTFYTRYSRTPTLETYMTKPNKIYVINPSLFSTACMRMLILIREKQLQDFSYFVCKHETQQGRWRWLPYNWLFRALYACIRAG